MELITRKDAVTLLKCTSHTFEALVNLGLSKHPPLNNHDQFSYDKEEVLELVDLDHGALLGFKGQEKFLDECDKWGDNMHRKKHIYKGTMRINTDGTVQKEPWTFADDKTVSDTIKEHYFGNGYEGNIVHNLDGSITIDIAREKTPREFTRIKGTLFRE